MTFFYLATPYTNQKNQMAAFHDAAHAAAILMSANINVFCPIAHGHPIQTFMPDRSHEWWMRMNEDHMRNAAGLIVMRMQGWEESRGMREEIEFFKAMKKRIIPLDWPMGPDARHHLADIFILSLAGDED